MRAEYDTIFSIYTGRNGNAVITFFKALLDGLIVQIFGKLFQHLTNVSFCGGIQVKCKCFCITVKIELVKRSKI